MVSPRIALFAVCSALVVQLGMSSSLRTQPAVKVVDAHQCKVMCQRFAYRFMGPEFQDSKSPTDCSKKCEAVYGGASPTSALEVKAEVTDRKAEVKQRGVDVHDANQCKVICQRFGMPMLGPDFEGIKSPVDCCKKCDTIDWSAQAA